MVVHSNYFPVKGFLEPGNPSVPCISGWLASLGEVEPRCATLAIDGEAFDVVADQFRADLLQHGINAGSHAFSFPVPLKYVDNQTHKVVLSDRKTGNLIFEASYLWKFTRTFSDFAGMLRESVIDPIIPTPFREEDKRVFAVMDNLADTLSIEGLRASHHIKVSVVMPVHNRESQVLTAVNSVLKQRYCNLQLIVVNDGSTDASLSQLQSICDERLQIINFENCHGVSRARNAALELAIGEIVAYLDSDNTWDDRYLAAMVGIYLRNQDALGWYGGQFLYRGSSVMPHAMRFGAFNKALLHNRNYIDLNAFCHTRSAIDTVKGFDESIRRFVDWDLILRISDVGKIYSVPIALSRYIFENAENTLTSQDAFAPDLELVRQSAQAREESSDCDFEGATVLATAVTVIIPSYHAHDDLVRCLDSLFDLPYRPSLQIIVVDNGSNEETLGYLNHLSSSGEIELIANGMNYGFTYAVNQGLAACKLDNDVLILNNDAVVSKQAIVWLQEAVQRIDGCGVAVPQQVLPPNTESIKLHVPYADHSFECDVNLSLHHRNVVSIPIFHNGEAVEVSFAPFFAVYFSRETLDELPYLDAEFGRHYRSDRIFCDYLRTVLGKKIYYISRSVVRHRLQQATQYLAQDKKITLEDAVHSELHSWEPKLAKRFGFRRMDWDT